MDNRTALYLRLSRDDEKLSESESITNQRDFLQRYAQAHALCVTAVFIDDGYSGTSFDRPDFKRMLAMIEEKLIDTVLTKDLSRLGRDYIQTGYFLEQYFPLHNVRYIAVNDGIDTALGGAGNDMSPFRAVFNDMYARDISKKVRTALQTKKLKGEFIGSRPPYGYWKDPQDKNRLVPDGATAGVVQEIYRRYLSGESLAGIARALSREGIPAPSARYQPSGGGAWNDTTVGRILSNPTYAGDLTQNRSRKINYKLNRKITLPREAWITVSGTHPPLISQADFACAARLLKTRGYDTRKRGGRTHRLSGLAYCRDCGGKMSFMSAGGGRTYLVCSRWRKNADACTSHCIREDYVEGVVREQLRALAAVTDREKMIRELILARDMQGGADSDTLRRRLDDILDFAAPAHSQLALLIDTIRIGRQKEIELQFRFRQPDTPSGSGTTEEHAKS